MKLFESTGQFVTYAVVLMLIGTGIVLGVGSYTFVYAQGFSYMSDDAAVCANCHIMQDHYDAWIKGSHHAVATCNDCHTPHDFLGKYLMKAINGFNHSFAFTTGYFHEPIQINEMNRRVTEQTCRECHADMVHAIDFAPYHVEPMDCIRCHDSVGHMR